MLMVFWHGNLLEICHLTNREGTGTITWVLVGVAVSMKQAQDLFQWWAVFCCQGFGESVNASRYRDQCCQRTALSVAGDYELWQCACVCSAAIQSWWLLHDPQHSSWWSHPPAAVQSAVRLIRPVVMVSIFVRYVRCVSFVQEALTVTQS
jgi:hypothetical protein